jgi:hypothetical protein
MLTMGGACIGICAFTLGPNLTMSSLSLTEKVQVAKSIHIIGMLLLLLLLLLGSLGWYVSVIHGLVVVVSVGVVLGLSRSWSTMRSSLVM